jgi:uncharacterized protein (TIGR03437 family)
MQMPKRLLLAFVAIAGSLAAQNPTITLIVNGGSGIPPGLPNYAIAQGSIFVVYGTNLGAAAPAGSIVNSAALPLPTTAGLAGTSIAVTVNGTTLPAPIVYTIPGQVAAILPSATPVGTGTLTLTYNGKSGSGPITVLASAFGISIRRTPAGHEIPAVTFATNQTELVSAADAAAPGDALVLFGTGLGPVAGGNDTILPQSGNIGTVPTVYVGGVPSTNVSYYGRSPGFPGLDQIVFTVPQNAPLGCQVSIVVETSNAGVPIVSNAPATAIGTPDQMPCTDPVDAFPAALLSFPANSTVLGISLQQNTTFSSPTTSATSTAFQILFTQLTPPQFLALSANMAESSNNSCFSGFVPAVAPPAGLPPAIYLDAGPSVTLVPPSGAPFAVPALAAGVYLGKSSAGIPSGLWGFAAPGGANVGPFSLGFPIPQPVTWTNQASLLGSTVTRANGLTINWTGGDPYGFVDIQGFAANTTGTFLVGYDCSAPLSAGTFTIPPSILLQMPTGPGAQATLQVSTFALPFTILPSEGFDAVVNFSQIQTLIPIVYQ